MYPGWEMYDEKEEDRLEHVQILKGKGKGAPKKKKGVNGKYYLCIEAWRELIGMCANDLCVFAESKRKGKKR